MRRLIAPLVAAALVALLPLTPSQAAPRTAAPGVTRVVRSDAGHDTSKPLRDLVANAPAPRGSSPRPVLPLPARAADASASAPATADPVVQATAAAPSMPAPSTTFAGLSNSDNPFQVLPPDTEGDVGPNDYVQWVNVSFAIYSKTGTMLLGPVDGNTPWSGFSGGGGFCASTNQGDPIVQYDQIADRWVFMQFAFDTDIFGDPVAPYYLCFAVSTTGDPTGSFYRYAFQVPYPDLPDYPKLGVWPDAYYMSMNLFSGGFLGNFAYAGAGAAAFERSQMLAGQTARMVFFKTSTQFGGMLPSDLDGSTLPPSGSPDYFLEVDPPSTMSIFPFHVDWTNTANSTFGTRSTLTTASFDENLCNFNPCLRQPGTRKKLDALSDRLMYRLAYRNFGDHEAMVVNHTVDANGSNLAGIRWYELRKTTGAWSIYQQATYAPNSVGRWMGSAAMDESGDIAIGFSASNKTVYPSIRYAGRLAGDPLGQLSQGEAILQAGTGSQTHSSGRWGDYSMLSVDPDGCTFWYTDEYYSATSSLSWKTRIGSFRFPGCT